MYAQHREVLLVVVAAHHDEDRAAGEVVVEVGQPGAAEEKVALALHEVHGVAGERLEPFAHPELGLSHRLPHGRLALPDPHPDEPVARVDAIALEPELFLPDLLQHELPHRVDERNAGSTNRSGPRFGYRPLIDLAPFTTPPTPAAISDSAETRSRSSWSITATSPGCSRWTSRFVRPSTRARPPWGLGRRSGRLSRLLDLVPTWETPWPLFPLGRASGISGLRSRPAVERAGQGVPAAFVRPASASSSSACAVPSSRADRPHPGELATRVSSSSTSTLAVRRPCGPGRADRRTKRSAAGA